MPQPQQPQQQINIKAKEDDLKGVYSNLMQISHTKEEFIMDFFFVSPPNGTLNSRVIMNPAHVKRMIAALNENLKRYEDSFGPIIEGQAPETKVGFGN